jgi:1-acyl-sn-glycerol-3-phosphate acyltransferase
MRRGIYQAMAWLYYLAAWLDGILLFRIMGIRLETDGIERKYPGSFYLIIANHQTWADILIIQHLLNFKAPVLKFLTKRELIFLPIVGWICWAYDFPFLQRQSINHVNNLNQKRRSDVQSLSSALHKFMRSSASIMNFVEGTRFSMNKSKRQNSPYTHLLKPKAGGLLAILKTFGSKLDAIIDVTIVYGSPEPHFWDFLCGRCKTIKVKAKTITPHDTFGNDFHSDSSFDFETITRWINDIWKNKDTEIEHMKTESTRHFQ